MKKFSFLLALIAFSTSTYAELPPGVVCLQNISKIQCASSDSNCSWGDAAQAKCYQSAVFKTNFGTFISVSESATGRSYECSMLKSDKKLAENNAKATLSLATGSFELIPKCD